MRPIRIGIVGAGKIAREQHIPAIRENAAFELFGCAHSCAPVDGVAAFPSLEAMLQACPDLEAVAISSPPQAHFEAASLALESGRHVLIEKPPCPTLMQLTHLERLARRQGSTLFQTWHARGAAAVGAAQELLKSRQVRGGRIAWKEDVRSWHPGQAWIWQAGGFGVFDAGINALSILTTVLAEPVMVKSAALSFPADCDTPVAADVTFLTAGGAEIAGVFDFRPTDRPVWDIDIETDEGSVSLSEYGNTLRIDGRPATVEAAEGEYALLYRRFAELIAAHTSEIDRRPLELVADIFLIGRRVPVEAFAPPGTRPSA